MSIQLYIEPRKVYTWKQFCQERPLYSIALDGFVDDATRRDPKGPYANFDHHSKIDRIVARSTSDQVHMEINLGLFETFRKEGIPRANVFVNDPDEDTCLAYWLLKHHEEVRDHANPKINRLVYCEDRLDATAGAYPFGETSMRRKMAWIFEPYNEARFKGRLHDLDANGIRTIIEATGARISEHVFNEGGELGLEGHYDRIGGNNKWAFVRESGPASRLAMYNDGIAAYVAVVKEKADGRFVYVLGRKSVWIPFDIEQLYERLNKEEGEIVNENNHWGGSNTIGGSPRETGSSIKPERLEKIIEEEVRQAS